MRIVFMGTPEFAVPSLDMLVRGGYEVALVVTQKDKPRDRGKETKAPPVKEYALSAGIPVLQPERLNREPDMVEAIRNVKPDLLVTCAFGQILPKSLLEIPPLGTINVHGSLLPALRGAAPIQWAVIEGLRESGITTMLTEMGIDTGDMLLKETVEIPEDMTSGELHDILSVVGAATLSKTLQLLRHGDLRRHPQDHALATHAPRLSKELGRIDWTKSAWEIHNLVRGCDPWPGAYTETDGGRMRVVRTESPGRPAETDATGTPSMENASATTDAQTSATTDAQSSATTDAPTSVKSSPQPGTLLSADATGLWVQAGDRPLRILEIQMPSSRRMPVADWLNGHPMTPGLVFGKQD